LKLRHCLHLLFIAALTLAGSAQPAFSQTAAKAEAAPSGLQRALNRRIEVTIRATFNVPPDYTIAIGKRGKSALSGYDSLPVTFSNGSSSKVMDFLISTDNNTLARMEKFDLSKGPLAGVNLTGRPIRGPQKALVTIVNFDDLECPFCARMHAELFPATLDHYKDQVRFIYLDDPLIEIHPWAMHAAVDVECLAAQSPAGYWNLVDAIHASADSISGDRQHPNLAGSMVKLDEMTFQEGQRQHVDMDKLKRCVGKQDEASIRASIKEADALGIEGTPTLYVNGERLMGIVPQNVLWQTIDRAIVDAGGTPPPATPADKAQTPPSAK
jgi:protein-disulfide isomerase